MFRGWYFLAKRSWTRDTGTVFRAWRVDRAWMGVTGSCERVLVRVLVGIESEKEVFWDIFGLGLRKLT